MRFPAISLTAEISAVAEGLADLNSFDAGEWNVLAGIFQPLFNSGQLKAQMKAQRARAEQAQHRFVGTLQNAFREVEDSLVAIVTYRREYYARQRQVTAASNAARLSRARYDGGIVDYLEVLDSERTLFDAELRESIVRRDAMIAFVTLYKALGGGWTPEDETGDKSSSDDAVESEQPADSRDEAVKIDDANEARARDDS
jgi:multidrug efflux system outer membrane protein